MKTNGHVSPLRAYREKQDPPLSQQALARLIGVQRTTVARWETGTRKIDHKQIESISRITGIPATQLRPDLAQLMELSGA